MILVIIIEVVVVIVKIVVVFDYFKNNWIEYFILVVIGYFVGVIVFVIEKVVGVCVWWLSIIMVRFLFEMVNLCVIVIRTSVSL